MREVRIENLRLICGDCMEVMESDALRLRRGGQDDRPPYSLAVCDPDYGLDGKLKGGNYMARYGDSGCRLGGKPTAEWFEALRRVSANQVVWGWNYFDFLPPTRCFLVWHKKDGPRNFADCEVAWTSFDRNARLFSSARNPKGVSGNGKRIVVCQKPVQLYEWTYNLLASKGVRILDTHMGSGSSAIAAWECGLEYTGVEIDPETFERAVERVRRHTANQKIKF